MSEDHPSTTAHRSWFDRLSQALSGEPRNIEELLEELRQAQANGLLSNDTLSMVEGAIEVNDLTVADVMVPRGQVVSLAANAPFKDNLAIVIESGHSRFPVHGDEKDEILGILLAKDLLRCLAEGVTADIRLLLRPVALIPASKKLNILLKEFRLSHNHMAIVVDEYGGVAGLITIEDVLEQIVGDIDDEHDDDDGESRQVTELDGQWLVNALTPIAEFNERFGSNFLDEEFDTVGGMITAEFGHLPEAGEEVTLGGFDFHVSKADDRRVHQFTVRVHAD
ncbi:MAG: magnesium/cobalt efflux protein [Lysobacterales bacterium 69-70]|nr:CBS domain-containing protein [Xanthomonadaceae bacterium]ODU32251.1 MAG: magnesium/cobalt efflux protein [Xanthomonadaceae bacterium SCN 69-320]ODV21473.1 MAG: magnesium/cobalt efflux protein [Xanthomonadaceae bacterium SCN 69-25]OJZ01975.1 MAG: magnesium/cobalt efflux protein [Xanthomonadales bacterium 69-70]